jgi:hypothetical protein
MKINRLTSIALAALALALASSELGAQTSHSQDTQRSIGPSDHRAEAAVLMRMLRAPCHRPFCATLERREDAQVHSLDYYQFLFLRNISPPFIQCR